MIVQDIKKNFDNLSETEKQDLVNELNKINQSVIDLKKKYKNCFNIYLATQLNKDRDAIDMNGMNETAVYSCHFKGGILDSLF